MLGVGVLIGYRVDRVHRQ